MSELLELQYKLQDTVSQMTQLERSVAQSPDSLGLRLSLQSVVKRFDELQGDFQDLADQKSVDVCSYRLFSDVAAGPSLRGFSGTLQEFQAAFTALFDAIRHGPRRRSIRSPDVVEATKFGLGYAYAGSVGVVLTLERERMLIDAGPLQDTITTFFSLAGARTSEEIREIGQRLGPAPIRSVFRWAEAHVSDGIGADISWRHGDETTRLFLQRAEMQRLRDEIDATSEETRKNLTLKGFLTGASIVTKRFDFQPEDADAIKGYFTDAISTEHDVRIPRGRYRASVEKVTKIQYSTEKETETWHLLRLDEIS